MLLCMIADTRNRSGSRETRELARQLRAMAQAAGPLLAALAELVESQASSPAVDNGGVQPPPLLLTADQAAELLAISPSTLKELTAPRGPIPVVRIGRSVRYSRATLAEWISQREAAGAESTQRS